MQRVSCCQLTLTSSRCCRYVKYHEVRLRADVGFRRVAGNILGVAFHLLRLRALRVYEL